MTDGEQLLYDSIGFSSIEFAVSEDGVTLVANADGLRSLARLFMEMADRSAADHIHLTPAMQLVPTSRPFVVARNEDGVLPDGSPAPAT